MAEPSPRDFPAGSWPQLEHGDDSSQGRFLDSCLTSVRATVRDYQDRLMLEKLSEENLVSPA